MTEYNGWANYETWCVNLWLDNDSGTVDMVREWIDDIRSTVSAHSRYGSFRYGSIPSLSDDSAQCGALADRIKEWIEENNPLIDEPDLYADLLGAAIGCVDYRSIAARWMEDYPPEEDEEDMSCDQCVAVMVNGVYCHETGCPNSRRVKVDGEWVDREGDEDYDAEEDPDVIPFEEEED